MSEQNLIQKWKCRGMRRFAINLHFNNFHHHSVALTKARYFNEVKIKPFCNLWLFNAFKWEIATAIYIDEGVKHFHKKSK